MKIENSSQLATGSGTECLTRVLCVGWVGEGRSWPGEETGDVVVSREEGPARWAPAMK